MDLDPASSPEDARTLALLNEALTHTSSGRTPTTYA